MAGNSQRRGAIRKSGTKKGAVKGSGGQSRKSREGRGATPPAEVRTGHPAARRTSSSKSSSGRGRVDLSRTTKVTGTRGVRRGKDLPETIVGRNPVIEALRADIPATALYIAQGISPDDRIREAVELAGRAGITVLEPSRHELDRLTASAIHQGIALAVPPYRYADPAALLRRAEEAGQPPLIVAVDGVTDPRNLGAIVRSAAAFGAHGVLIPERRSAGMTASAWRTSAGTAARLPVARCTNLVRTLKEYASAGLMLAGLDADGTVDTDSFDLATSPLVVVVGSEGRGLARLTRDTCDVTVSIPMASKVESLNASVAAGVVLAEVARRRREPSTTP